MEKKVEKKGGTNYIYIFHLFRKSQKKQSISLSGKKAPTLRALLFPL